MEPEKPTSGPGPRLTSAGPQASSKSSPTGSRGGGAYTPPPRVEKPKRKWLALVLAVAAVAGGGGVGVHYYMSEHSNPAPISATAPSTQQNLTVTGADLDVATTQAAIAAIQARQNDNPLIANLTAQQKQEIVDGQRKFYKLPVIPAGAQYAPPQGATPHAAHQPSPQAKQPTPAHVVPHATGPGDIVQIVLDGVVYGSYNITTSPFTLDAPLKVGDVWSVSCLQLAAGKSSVTVGIGTDLNPVQSTLAVGQSETFTVTAGPVAATAQDYAWFHTQAANGNPTAQYGLGHMYEYGIGVQQNTSQAIYWYRLAANQNYPDASQRLVELGQ